MKIITNLDYTRVVIEGIPLSIEKTGTDDITKVIFDNDGDPFVIELNKVFYIDERINKNAPAKGVFFRAGFIENVQIDSIDKPTSSLWYIRSHRLTLAYYILGPMLLTETFDFKSKLGVGLCLANVYHQIDLPDMNRLGEIYVLYRSAMRNLEVYSLLSTNETKLNLTKHEHYVEHFTVDHYHDMYVFKIPKEYKEVYDLYLEGKWSHFPDKFRTMVYNWAPNRQRAQIWKWRFQKENILRQKLMQQLDIEISKDAELCQAPNGDETFTEKSIIPNQKLIDPKKNVTISTERSDRPDDQVD